MRPLRAAYLGPMHSYSHLATLKYFGDAIELVPVGTIEAVFDAIDKGEVDTGVVPVENSTDGRVVDTLGIFVRRDMEYLRRSLVADPSQFVVKHAANRNHASAK